MCKATCSTDVPLCATPLVRPIAHLTSAPSRLLQALTHAPLQGSNMKLSASNVASRPQVQAFGSARPRLVASRCSQPQRALACAALQQSVSSTSSSTWCASPAVLGRSVVSSSHGSKAAGSRRCLRVHASWGAPVEFSPAKVLSTTQAAKALYKIVVDVGADIAAGYTKAGQFVQLKVTAINPYVGHHRHACAQH